MSKLPSTPMSLDMLEDERFHGSTCATKEMSGCTCGMVQNMAYVEREAVEDFIRDELPGLLAEAIHATVPRNDKGQHVIEDCEAGPTSGTAIAAKVAEIRAREH